MHEISLGSSVCSVCNVVLCPLDVANGCLWTGSDVELNKLKGISAPWLVANNSNMNGVALHDCGPNIMTSQQSQNKRANKRKICSVFFLSFTADWQRQSKNTIKSHAENWTSNALKPRKTTINDVGEMI